MLVTVGYSVRHSSTSSDYMWHQQELIKYTYYSTAMEYCYDTAALDQSESWNTDLDASQIHPIPAFRNYLEMYLLLKALKKMEF